MSLRYSLSQVFSTKTPHTLVNTHPVSHHYYEKIMDQSTPCTPIVY